MKRVKRDTMIDTLIWIVIITQVILSATLVFVTLLMAEAVQSIAIVSVQPDISTASVAEPTNYRSEYEDFMRDLRDRIEIGIQSRWIVEESESLEGKDLYVSYIYEICEKYPNVDPAVFTCLVESESHYNPEAKNYNGTCVGLSQLSTKWHTNRAKSLGVDDLMDPYGNLLTGIDYFSDLMTSANGDPELAIMLYHMRADDAWALYRSGRGDPYARHILAKAKEV